MHGATLINHRAQIDSGFSITPEQIGESVTNYFTSNVVAGWNNLGTVISSIRSTPEVRWASAVEVKTAVEKVFLERFGPKESAKGKAKVRISLVC